MSPWTSGQENPAACCSRGAAVMCHGQCVSCRLSLEEATAKSTAEAAQLADVTAQLQAAHEAGAVAAEREECLAARVQELLVSWQAAQDSGQAEAALRADAEVRAMRRCCLQFCCLCGARYHII